MKLTFEDFKTGHYGSFGPRHVSREEILEFAAEFDPQPMHLDEEAAGRSMLGGLAGSGWHLCSIMMRMMFDGFLGRTASLGSPGVKRIALAGPVAAGRRFDARCRDRGSASLAQPAYDRDRDRQEHSP